MMVVIIGIGWYFWGFYRVIEGIYWDNGRENESYCLELGV